MSRIDGAIGHPPRGRAGCAFFIAQALGLPSWVAAGPYTPSRSLRRLSREYQAHHLINRRKKEAMQPRVHRNAVGIPVLALILVLSALVAGTAWAGDSTAIIK